MPTGYTYIIEERDDVSFEEFVWRCARGMGALIMLRDEPMDAEIPERFEPSAYHKDALERAIKQRDELLNTSPEALARRAAEEKGAAEASFARSLEEYGVKHRRYRRMIDKVAAWTPPSPDHENFKSFMLEQLSSSLPGGPYAPHDPPEDVEELMDERLGLVEKDIEYHRRHWEEEVKRTEERNAWLRQLRESVPYVRPKK
jgi:hypothetical protein